jgi:hypothetical protein
MVDRIAAASDALHVIVEQLEPMEKGLLSFTPGGFIDPVTREFAKEVQERQRAGLFLLRAALRTARWALQSGDPNLILAVEGHCERLFYVGLMLRERAHAHVARARAGGIGRGAKVRAKTSAVWEPWESEYLGKIAGKDRAAQLKIRRQIEQKMKRAGFVDPISGAYPDRKTIAKHLPSKIMENAA